MSTTQSSRLLLVVALGALAGCGSTEPEPGSCDDPDAPAFCPAPDDAGFPDVEVSDQGSPDMEPDVGPVDLGPVDTGVLPFEPCAEGGPGKCAVPADCGRERPAPTNCPFCPPDHSDLCIEEACASPALLEPTDVQEVGFTVEGAFSPDLQALVGVVIAAETPSGAMLDCERVTQPDFELDGACYNVLTSRSITIFQVAESYTFQFGTFPGGLPVLLLVYGFDERRPEGAPRGVSCTPHMAGLPGSGRSTLFGAPMRAF